MQDGMVGLGILIGHGLAIGGIAARDPITLAANVGVVLAVAVVASFVPARRVLALDPASVMREK
jgi:ABC-type antimicrobial peptide transport system permease subunit